MVQAVLHELVAQGLGGDARVHRLLFGGLSAGARGAMVHLDYIGKMLPLDDASRRLVEVRGYLDSAMWLDQPPLRADPSAPWFHSLADSTRAVSLFANVTHLGSECAAQHADATWKCLFGEYRMPLVRTPFLAIGAQFDTYQLDHLLGCGTWACGTPKTADDAVAVDAFAHATANLARSLAVGARAIYSSRCHRHAVSLNDADFGTRDCGGASSLEGMLLAFLEQPTSALPISWVDDSCEGFDCCCHVGTQADAMQLFGAALTAAMCCVAVWCLCRRRRRGRRSSMRWFAVCGRPWRSARARADNMHVAELTELGSAAQVA